MAQSKKGKPAAGAERSFDPAALDALLGDASTAEDVETLFRQMKQALMERMLAGELTCIRDDTGWANLWRGASPRALPFRPSGSVLPPIATDRSWSPTICWGSPADTCHGLSKPTPIWAA